MKHFLGDGNMRMEFLLLYYKLIRDMGSEWESYCSSHS